MTEQEHRDLEDDQPVMSKRMKNIRGEKIHRLTAIRFIGLRYRRARWEWQCECGNITQAMPFSVRTGHIKSCGCLLKEVAGKSTITHGHSRNKRLTPEYLAWRNMRRRCDNPNNSGYKSYGGRGIRVCDEWLHSFETFFADVGPRPSPKHSLDRFPDTNGNYEPGNIRWATDTEQARNQTTNRLIVINGITKCLSEWAEISGIKVGTLWDRLRRGWPPERAITQPLRPMRRR